ncbi:DNA breaking-rejoining enzyme, partial [Mycena polygramma]
CDVIDLEGQPIPEGKAIATKGTAETIRAALLYKFGTVQGLGRTPWRAKPLQPTQFEGNPVFSDIVSDFIISLKRRKVISSVEALAKFVRPDFSGQGHLLALYNFLVSKTPRTDDQKWCHENQRYQGHCMETWGLQCMLRSAELVRIRWDNIKIHYNPHDDDDTYIDVHIPTCKTSQFGGEPKFYRLWMMPFYLAHLCPVRAFFEYISRCRHTTGYLFRNINKSGQISQTNTHITSRRFNEIMRMQLLDIHVDPPLFGTHALRRGGAQYHALVRGEPIPVVCAMGGWALGPRSSIWRYLMSPTDQLHFDSADFLNPRRVGPKCWGCGSAKGWEGP